MERLCAMHDALADRIEPGDRVIYLGNFLGYGPDIIGIATEVSPSFSIRFSTINNVR